MLFLRTWFLQTFLIAAFMLAAPFAFALEQVAVGQQQHATPTHLIAPNPGTTTPHRFPFRTTEMYHDGYTFTWHLGKVSEVGTAEHAMREFQNNPQDMFPFPIHGQKGEKELVQGGKYNLHVAYVPIYKPSIEIVEVGPTHVTARTLPGHFLGPGAEERFGIHEAGGHLFLTHEASKVPSTWLTPFFNFGARLAWSQQANRLKRYLERHPQVESNDKIDDSVAQPAPDVQLTPEVPVTP